MANGHRPGVFFGQAFRWQAGHTQLLELALALEGLLPVAADVMGGHPALHAVGRRQERPLVIAPLELPAHVLLTGTTRSGKTTLLEVIAEEVIGAPGAVAILDPKGSRRLLARCALSAQRQGKRFALIIPAFHDRSHRLNVLSTATMPAEVSARIRALMPSAGGRVGDPFFEEFPLALIDRLAFIQAALGQPWTLEGLYAVSAHFSHLERLLSAYLVSLGHAAQRTLRQQVALYEKTGPADLVADAVIGVWEHGAEHFRKITSSLEPAFRGVTGLPLGPLFSSVTTTPLDLTWQRIVDEEMVVYVGLASMMIGDIANRIGRVILQDLVGYLGRRYAYEDMAHVTPITVMVDELRTMVYPLFINAVAMGGEAQARFVLAQQSFADVQGLFGKDLADTLYDNLNTKVTFRLAHDPTAKALAEGLGTCTVRLPETGVGLSYGGVGGLSGSAQRRMRQDTVPLVRPEWLKALPRGHAFARVKGELFKLRVPLLEPVTDAQLDQLGLTDIWHRLADVEAEEDTCAPSV